RTARQIEAGARSGGARGGSAGAGDGTVGDEVTGVRDPRRRYCKMPGPVKAVNDYGLDAELAAIANAKYDPAMEREAEAYISSLTSADFSQGFGPTLRDGVVLAEAMNALKPGSVRVYRGSMPFKQMENISGFIQGCRRMGVAESDLFTTVALFEEKNLMQVIQCVLALKRVAGGGSRGVAGARPKSRFNGTNPDASVSMLNMGSAGIMDTRRDTGNVSESNRGQWGRTSARPDSSVSKLNMGSAGIMDTRRDTGNVDVANRSKWARSVGNPNASVSMLNMGSAGIMDTRRDTGNVDVANRAKFGGAGSNPNGSISKLNAGSYGTMESTVSRQPMQEANRASYAKTWSRKSQGATSSVDRGPNSQYGVSRRMPWETSRGESQGHRHDESDEDYDEADEHDDQRPVNAATPAKRSSFSKSASNFFKKMVGAGDSEKRRSRSNVRSIRGQYEQQARARSARLPPHQVGSGSTRFQNPADSNDPKFSNYAKYR
ncbi:Myophilin, partial [Durusdinium trenchii]